jgi:curved DNA-binding protein CbpA
MRSKSVSAFLNHSNYYDALDIPRDFTAEQLTTAYRSLARSLHPDRNRDPRAGDAIALLNNMRATLADPDSRAHYERTTFAKPTSNRPSPPPRRRPTGTSFTDKVKRFFGGGMMSLLKKLLIGCGIVLVLYAGYRILRWRAETFDRADVVNVISAEQPAKSDYAWCTSDPHRFGFAVYVPWYEEHCRSAGAQRKLYQIADEIFMERLRSN